MRRSVVEETRGHRSHRRVHIEPTGETDKDSPDISGNVSTRYRGRDAASREALRKRGSELQSRPLRILVVDDSDLNRKMNRRTLESDPVILSNSFILEADDGDAAVAMVRDSQHGDGVPIDCILMDTIMLRLNGNLAMQIMRQELQFKGLIISITGNVLPSERQELLDAGADFVVAKPMKKANLLDLVRGEFGLPLPPPSEAL